MTAYIAPPEAIGDYVVCRMFSADNVTAHIIAGAVGHPGAADASYVPRREFLIEYTRRDAAVALGAVKVELGIYQQLRGVNL